MAFFLTRSSSSAQPSSGGFCQIQVTLDGTEGVYNAVKRYVDAGEKSPYQVVLANIRGLLDAGVRVIVRLNVSRATLRISWPWWTTLRRALPAPGCSAPTAA